MLPALMLFVAAAGSDWQVVAGKWAQADGAWRGSGGWLASSKPFDDGVVTLEFEHTRGPRHTFGVGFRYEGTAGTPTAGGLGVNFTEGAFNVFEGTGNAWQPVNPAWKEFQPTALLKPGKNALKIECAGKSVRITLNDRPLAAFETTKARGPVVLWVESADEVVGFSNVRISSTPPAPR